VFLVPWWLIPPCGQRPQLLACPADDGRAVAEAEHVHVQGGQLVHRGAGLSHVQAELRIGPGQLFAVDKCIAGKQQPSLRQVVAQVASRMPRRGHGPQLAQAGEGHDVAIVEQPVHGAGSRGQEPILQPHHPASPVAWQRLWRLAADHRGVGGRGVDGGAGGGFERRQAAGVVEVVMREEDVCQVLRLAAQAGDVAQHLARLPGHTGVHQRQLIAYQQVSIDEAEAGEQVYLREELQVAPPR